MGKLMLDGYEEIALPCPQCGEIDDFMPTDDGGTLCINCDFVFHDDKALQEYAESIGIYKIGSFRYHVKRIVGHPWADLMPYGMILFILIFVSAVNGRLFEFFSMLSVGVFLAVLFSILLLIMKVRSRQ